MPVPSSVQAATTYNYVNSLDLVVGLHKPEVDESVTARYGNQNLSGFFEQMGMSKSVSAIEFHHYEDDWLHQEIKVAVQSGAAANAKVTLTIDPTFAKTFPGTAQSPYIVADNQTGIPVRPNDVIEFPTGVQAQIVSVDTSVSPATFEVIPIVLGEAIPTTTTATEIFIVGNAWGEQTGQPAGRESNINLYTNNLLIGKSTSTVSGTEAGVQTWIQVPDESGRMGFLWYFKSWNDEYKRAMNECEQMLLLGQKITNTTLANERPTTTITEGLIPFIKNLGNTQDYSGGIGYQLQDLETSILTLDRERGSKENAIWAGLPLSIAMDKVFIDLFKSGGVTYGAFNGSQDKAVDLQFKSFSHGGYTFHKRTYETFTYPRTLGVVGSEYPTAGIFMPLDNIKAAKTGESVPSCRVRYLQGKGNSYNRGYEEWLTGAANGIYTGDTDELNVNRRFNKGFEGFAPNRFIYLTQA